MSLASPLLRAESIDVFLNRRQVLSKVSLSLNPESILTIVGPNGSGKTTLLRAMLGIIPVQSGSVTRALNTRMGYMPQRFLIPRSMPMTVLRLLSLHACRANHSHAPEAVAEEVGISALLERQVHHLSGGEWQRVLLARAMLHHPQVLMLDEPTQGVDAHGQTEFYRLLLRLRDHYNMAIILVSHDLHLVMRATDHVICLNHHVCCEGRPEDIATNPAYQQLFGSPNVSSLAVYAHHHDHQH
jgi:zinc transport system ATP-binding protein